MEQATTSKETEDSQQLGPETIGSETTKMLNRIIWKLKLDQTSTTKSIPISDPIARTARYTGMNEYNVRKILAFGDSWEFEHIEIDRLIIHRQLMNMYLLKNYIPTITGLFKALHDKLPMSVNLDSFTKILVKMGYVFYKFPKRKALRVMEKRSVTFDRYRYLKSIQEYRNDNIPIVYIGLASVSSDMTLLSSERTLQTDITNIISYILFTVADETIENIKVFPKATHEVLQKSIKDWLLELFVLKNLPQGTVCVFEDSKIFRDKIIDVPTWKSVKSDMLEWLDDNNIPCHIDMSKAELLQLIETCTDTKKNTFLVDCLVQTPNYTLLRLPECINGLSIVSLLIRFINDKYNVRNMLTSQMYPAEILSKVSVLDLKFLSNAILLEEKRQLEEDIQLDNAIDELVRNMKVLKIDLEDGEDDLVLPTLSDSD